MSETRRSLAYSFGAFWGHIVGAVRARPGGRTHTVRRTEEEEDRGGVVLRRTTIEEVEFTEHRPAAGAQVQRPLDPQAPESGSP